MFSWPGRRRQEAREEGGMSCEGEAAGRMPLLPAVSPQKTSQVGRASLRPRLVGNIVAQCVQGEQQQIISADDLIHVHAGTPRFSSRCHAATAAVYVS